MKILNVCSVLLVLSGFLATSAFGISLVDAEWVKANMNADSVRIVDVQNKPGTYGKGHIPGAVEVHRHIDLADETQEPPNLYPTAEQFEQLLEKLGIDNETTVVAYDDKFGLFASRLLMLMEIYGHDIDKLKLVDGGMVSWKDAGYATSTDHVDVEKTDYAIAYKRNDILITWSDIYRDVLAGVKPDITLIDVRPANEYKGERIRAIRGGHIPGAINITGSKANDSETHKFKSLDAIRAMYEDHGLNEDSLIYEYCNSGDRAAHVYIQLKHMLGYKNVKVYGGGWQAWAEKTYLPGSDVTWLWEK